jgi:hypothetical protein
VSSKHIKLKELELDSHPNQVNVDLINISYSKNLNLTVRQFQSNVDMKNMSNPKYTRPRERRLDRNQAQNNIGLTSILDLMNLNLANSQAQGNMDLASTPNPRNLDLKVSQV